MPRSHILGGGMKCGDANNPSGPGLKHNGDPCNLAVVPGTFRCFLHGASTAPAKLKAEQTMALLRLPALDLANKVMLTLEGIIDQFLDNACATCGYPNGDIEEKEAVIKACRSAVQSCMAVLDRAGLGPRSVLEIQQTDGDLDLSLLTDDERSRMMALLAEYEDMKTIIRVRINGGPQAQTSTIQ